MQYNGIIGSSGIAIAKAYIYQRDEIVIDKNVVAEERLYEEEQKLDIATAQTKEQINQIMQQTVKELGKEEAAIFDAHLMILEDPELVSAVKMLIKTEKINASYAAMQVIERYIETFSCMEDEYLKERAADIRDIGDRLIRNILGMNGQIIGSLDSDVIIVAHDLTPSDTAVMDKKHVRGFVLNSGGRTSHTAIMARGLEIPAVLGIGDLMGKTKSEDIIIVDGNAGTVIVNPDQETLAKYQRKRKKHIQFKNDLKKVAKLPSVTLDGRHVELAANIGDPGDVDAVIEYGGDGIGLFRTEFLYMNRINLPSENEQFEAYIKVAEKMQGRPVIIRTLDIGGDKELPYIPREDEANPFLGWRAIRICFEMKDMFKTQLRAILRASVHRNIRIMYPMISDVNEAIKANRILEETKCELRENGIMFDKDIQCGVMVEIPSAALTADIIIDEVDFFSIGTNDLCQYTLAVDRTNQKISKLYQPFHPGVLRLIKNVIDASHKAGKFTGMCGELASDPAAALLFLGMGLNEFSMSASSLPIIKQIVRNVTSKEVKRIAEHALSLRNAEQIQEYCISELKKLNVMNMEV